MGEDESAESKEDGAHPSFKRQSEARTMSRAQRMHDRLSSELERRVVIGWKDDGR